MKIYNRFTKDVISKCAKETTKEAVIEAVKAKADLSNANLSKTTLCDTKFKKTIIYYIIGEKW